MITVRKGETLLSFSINIFRQFEESEILIGQNLLIGQCLMELKCFSYVI